MQTSKKVFRIKPFHSIAFNIFMGIFIFIIIPVSVGFFYSYRIFENIITEEISKNNVKNITQFKDDVSKTFDNMIKLSNVIINDDSFQNILENDNTDYYNRSKVISRVFEDLVFSSDLENKGVKITFFDKKDQGYSNWSLNFNDYRFILDKDWIREAGESNFYAIWSDFETSFIKEESKVKYVSFARNIESKSLKNIGTLIISLSEKEFSRIFRRYIPEKSSCLFMSSPKEGIVTYVDDVGISKYKEVTNFIKSDNENNPEYKLLDINNKKYLVNSYNIRKNEWTSVNKGWKITIISSYENIDSQLKVFSSKTTVVIILATIFLLLAATYITGKIFYPIKKLEQGMYNFDINNNLSNLNLKRKDEIGYLNRAFYNMGESIKELFDNLKNEHTIKEKYRYESLRAQLNPHFLFNTLNTIRWMAIIRKADNIVQSIDALSDILKYSMNRGGELIPLKYEMDNIKSYVFIQNNRYGSSYEVRYDIDESLMELKIIKFILQPIVENSILHAFEDRDGIGCITIKGIIEKDNLILSVEDNGIGMSDTVIKEIFEVKDERKNNDKKVTGLGIRTIDEMLKIACGHQYGLQVLSNINNGTEIRLVLPIINGEETINV